MASPSCCLATLCNSIYAYERDCSSFDDRGDVHTCSFSITRERAVLVTSTSLDWPRVLLALTILLLALGWLLTYLWWRRRPIP